MQVGIFTIVIFFPFMYYNIAANLDKEGAETAYLDRIMNTCPGFSAFKFPCFMFYSRMQDEIFIEVFPLTLIFFGLFRLRSQLSNLVKYTSDEYQEVF